MVSSLFKPRSGSKGGGIGMPLKVGLGGVLFSEKEYPHLWQKGASIVFLLKQRGHFLYSFFEVSMLISELFTDFSALISTF